MGMLLRRYHEGVDGNAAPSTALETVSEVVTHAEPIAEQPEQADETFSKTEINRMSKADLVLLATNNGLEVGEEESGASLKKRLVELLVK